MSVDSDSRFPKDKSDKEWDKYITGLYGKEKPENYKRNNPEYLRLLSRYKIRDYTKEYSQENTAGAGAGAGAAAQAVDAARAARDGTRLPVPDTGYDHGKESRDSITKFYQEKIDKIQSRYKKQIKDMMDRWKATTTEPFPFNKLVQDLRQQQAEAIQEQHQNLYAELSKQGLNKSWPKKRQMSKRSKSRRSLRKSPSRTRKSKAHKKIKRVTIRNIKIKSKKSRSISSRGTKTRNTKRKQLRSRSRK